MDVYIHQMKGLCMKCMKVLSVLVVSFLIFPVMAQQKYNLPVSAEKYYSEMKKGVLNNMVLKGVNGLLEDKSKVYEVMQKIDESIDMDQLKADTWPCLSKLPEKEWYTNTGCFNDFISDIELKTVTFVSLANANEELDSSSTSLSAIQKGAKISYDKAMAKYYVNNLLQNVAMLSVMAQAANAGEGKDMTFAESGLSNEDSPIFSGVTLFAKKDGTVSINFPDKCIAKDFEISTDEFIDMVKEEYREIPSQEFLCEGHKCVWKMKQSEVIL